MADPSLQVIVTPDGERIVVVLPVADPAAELHVGWGNIKFADCAAVPHNFKHHSDDGFVHTWTAPVPLPPDRHLRMLVLWHDNGDVKRYRDDVVVGQVAGQSPNGGRPHDDSLAAVLRSAVRVTDTPGRTDPGRGDVSDWVASRVGESLPRLSRNATSEQFRVNLAELSARAGGRTASPYVAAPLAAATGAVAVGMAPTDLGGPYAALRAEVDALERTAVPALRDLRSIVADADLDVVEAEREIVLEAASTLIEAARVETPEPGVLAAELDVLETHFDLLEGALGLTNPNNATSSEDFANLSRGDVVDARITTLKTVLGTFQPSSGNDPRFRIAMLVQYLAVVAENVDDLVGELDAFDLGERERSTIVVAAAGMPDISLDALLTMTADQAGDVLPHMLSTSARRAGPVVSQTLTRIGDYIDGLPSEGAPWDHPIVVQAAADLKKAVTAAIKRANNL